MLTKRYKNGRLRGLFRRRHPAQVRDRISGGQGTRGWMAP